MSNTVRILSVAVALFGAAACSHDNKPTEHAGPTASGPARELSAAVDSLTDARCDLEERCNHIGADQTYSSREACETKLHGSTADDLNTQDCPRGVHDAKLDACLQQIKAEECGDPIEAMSRWNACRAGALCAD